MSSPNKGTAKLLELAAENPDLPIVPMVNYEVVADDSYGYWMGSFDCCRIGEYACYNGKFFDDEGELEDEYYSHNEDEYEGWTDEDITADIKEKTANMWTKAIIVYIETPTLEMIDNE